VTTYKRTILKESVESPNIQDDSDESVEDLVRESLDDATADNAGKRDEEDIDRSDEQLTTRRYGKVSLSASKIQQIR
jgi:hypothetical protein